MPLLPLTRRQAQSLRIVTASFRVRAAVASHALALKTLNETAAIWHTVFSHNLAEVSEQDRKEMQIDLSSRAV